MKYVRVACQLVRTLLASAEGREYPFFTEFCDGVFSTLLLELGKVSDMIWDVVCCVYNVMSIVLLYVQILDVILMVCHNVISILCHNMIWM